MTEAILRQLDALGEGYRALVKVVPEHLDKARHEVLKRLAGKGIPGIVVLFTTPYATAKGHLEKEGVDVTKMFFIDCLTSGYASPREDNVIYIGDITDLTDIAIAVSQFQEAVAGLKYLVMDSVNALLIYHDLKTAAKFVNALAARATMLDMEAVVFAAKGNDPDFIRTISPFFDKVIEHG